MLTDAPLLPAPSDPDAHAEWRRELAAFRAESTTRLRYDGSLYARPEFAWCRSNFSCCMAMLFDTQIYDAKSGRWTLDSFMRQGVERFGGYDSVVFWHAYPRIGFDDRNQFDFYREMPGGLAALAALTASLHKQDVRVFVDYNPWDTSTRREQGSDEVEMARIVGALGADGVFLDTLSAGRHGWRATLDSVRPGVALESELALPLEGIASHHMSWAQGFADSHAPGVLRNKWFERRHMMHVVNRWRPHRYAEIQTAWMNGVGVMVWENVFGTTMGYDAHDNLMLRIMLPIQRRFARHFSGENWTPLVRTGDVNVFASLWEFDESRLWTLVNRAAQTRQGGLLEVEYRSDCRWFDLMRGTELTPTGSGTHRVLPVSISSHGIGAILAIPAPRVDENLLAFLKSQSAVSERGIAASRPILPMPPSRTPCVIQTIPDDMTIVPAHEWQMTIAFRERECGFYRHPELQPLTPAVLGQVAERARTGLPEFGSVANGQLHQAVVVSRPVKLRRYAMDLTPVTNFQFARFLSATRYSPRDGENFLRHWHDGHPPAGFDDHPVVYVDLIDARAFATWAGKRLPTAEEWQFAAQGPDQRLYPWGNEWLADRCNAVGATTTSVRAFALGRSPFGCFDMIGNTWEWTESEQRDERTRFSIIKGGSFYRAADSDWYADGGPRYCNFAAKFVLMWPGLDRCATIGFRCAADVPP